MSDQANTGLREEVRSRYAEAARVVLEPKAGVTASCCASASVTFTAEAASGIHSAIIRAVKPVR